MKLLYFFILPFALILGSGCTGSKSYSNKAEKLQKAGLNDEAANFFLQALQRNPKNVDAKIGLKQTGQVQIEKTLTKFYKSYSVGNYKEAVFNYQEALGYEKRYGYFVAMEIPPYYQDYYDEMLVIYLEEVYDNAEDLLYENKFSEANVIYREILELDPDYKDVADLSLHATVEPLYRSGVLAFEQKKYRKTYDIMSRVLGQKSMYKDAIDYKERALEEGKMAMAVLPFETSVSGKENLALSIQSDVVSSLTQINNPFIQVIDRTNSQDLIREQQLNVRNTSTGNSAITTGELLGANMLIKGQLLSYSSSGGIIRSNTRQGFEQYKVKKINPETKKSYYETKYKRVTYYEYEGSASVYLQVQYQMISAETGEVVQSKVEGVESKDNVHYITYSGNYKNLYSGKFSSSGMEFSKGDVIYTSYSQQNALRSLATNHKTRLKPESTLAAEAVNSVTRNIVQGIESYNPDEN